MALLRAWLTLFWMSFRRLLWSTNTLMVLMPLAICALLVFRLQGRVHDVASRDFSHAFDYFSRRFVLEIFVPFLVPICALAYGTTSIGGDREDRTLIFLLMRPLPRAWILLAKVAATLPLTISLVIGSFYGYCRMVGDVGELAFRLFLPAMFCMTLAYVCAFHLFAVSFRHSTILALVYAIFMEMFLGQMPGIVKRVSVSYYGQAMIYDLGANEGLKARPAQWFEPLAAQTSFWALLGIALAALIGALLIFQRREYRDLS